MKYQYLEEIKKIIQKLEEVESSNIDLLVDKMLNTIKNGNSIFAFGAGHAGILTQELYYRAGGLVLINPVFGRDLLIDTIPVTLTSTMERLDGYGRNLVDASEIKKDDLVIIHSVSGRNSAGIDFAIRSRELGAYVVAITNLKYSASVYSRHSSNKLLYEVSDLVVDNHGEIGDAAINIESANQSVAPSSTVSAVMILNTVISEVCLKLSKENSDLLPIFYSANVDGGDDLNKKVFEKYKKQIHYKL